MVIDAKYLSQGAARGSEGMGLGMVERTQIMIKFVSFNTEDERPRQVRAAESGG